MEDLKDNKVYLKCKRTLIEYIQDRIRTGCSIELFSSWADEEELERNKNLDIEVYFDEEDSLENLEIRDRQYVRFYLSRTGS